MVIKKKGGHLICMRPENIVEARFKLTNRQNDIMDMVFASITDDDSLEYEIDLAKYAQLYELKDKTSIYSELKKTVKTFEGAGFSVISKDEKNKEEDEEWFSWFSRIKYINGEGRIVVELGKTLKEIFLKVKRLAYYNISYTLNFKSIYSKRLYYYLKLYEDKGIRLDNIDTLRDKLQCPAGYKNYADFKRFVLEPAMAEINGNSDITFTYEHKKTGKKVTHLTFYIKTNKRKVPQEHIPTVDTPELQSENENIKKLVEMMKEKNITEDEAKAIYRDAEGNMGIIAKVYEHSKTVEIKKTFVGFMRNMVKPGAFKEPITQPKPFEPLQPKPTRFGSYEQRDFDPSLEFKLLGWDKD